MHEDAAPLEPMPGEIPFDFKVFNYYLDCDSKLLPGGLNHTSSDFGVWL